MRRFTIVLLLMLLVWADMLAATQIMFRVIECPICHKANRFADFASLSGTSFGCQKYFLPESCRANHYLWTCTSCYYTNLGWAFESPSSKNIEDIRVALASYSHLDFSQDYFPTRTVNQIKHVVFSYEKFSKPIPPTIDPGLWFLVVIQEGLEDLYRIRAYESIGTYVRIPYQIRTRIFFTLIPFFSKNLEDQLLHLRYVAYKANQAIEYDLEKKAWHKIVSLLSPLNVLEQKRISPMEFYFNLAFARLRLGYPFEAFTYIGLARNSPYDINLSHRKTIAYGWTIFPCLTLNHKIFQIHGGFLPIGHSFSGNTKFIVENADLPIDYPFMPCKYLRELAKKTILESLKNLERQALEKIENE